MTAPDLTSKYLGGMVGSAVGDAIGELAFGMSEAEPLRSLVADTDPLVWTDDTAMAIGIAESLTELGHLDPQALGCRFHENYLQEPWRGYASGPPYIFRTVGQEDIPYVEAARRLFGGQGSLGNGAAMRIAPIGLAFHASDSLDAMARASAEVTHAHPVGQDGAAVLAAAVAQAVPLDPSAPFPRDDFCRTLIEAAHTEEIATRMEMVRDLIAGDAGPAEAADAIGRTVAVHESMPFAVYAFLRHPESFEACLLCAALNGGDCDTLGAMACAISGAYLGIDAIPAAWREKLEKRAAIEDLARRLMDLSV